MANKQQVIDLHEKYPNWTSVQIAERLGCMDSYVRATFYRQGLTLPITRGHRPRKEGDSVYALGTACKAVGMTINDIVEFAANRPPPRF